MMGGLIPVAGALLVGFVLGCAAIWFMRRNAEALAQARMAEMAASVSRLTHDLRGAMSPALLMAERLERHDDPAVRQAAEVVAKAMQRASTMCREVSAAAKRDASEG
jgi:signal transduction histidine kinase